MIPDEEKNEPSGEENEFSEEENLTDSPSTEEDALQDRGDQPRRKRVRVKVRKRIRIKKKPSAKKLMRKIAERAFWTLIIAGFIASLIIMIVELDIKDEKFKQQRRKVTPTRSR